MRVVFLLLLPLFFSVTLAFVADLLGKVVPVLDGDTLDVLHNQHSERIRLNSIDCPEKGQAYGKESEPSHVSVEEKSPSDIQGWVERSRCPESRRAGSWRRFDFPEVLPHCFLELRETLRTVSMSEREIGWIRAM